MTAMTRWRGARPMASRGFTMVELLIAGLLSAVVLISIYFVFIGNTTQYYRQEQIVQMQESMRFALEYLKNDLRNVGRLGVTRGSGPDRDPRLCTDRQVFAAVTVCEEPSETLAALAANDNARVPDRLRLVTDTGGGVLLTTARVAPDRIVLAAAIRQPTVAARAAATSQARMEQWFPVGGRLVLRTSGSAASMDVVEISGVAFNVAGTVISLAEPLCAALSTCGSGCLVNGLETVEYAVRPTPPPANPAEEALDERFRLVRRTLPPEEDPAACREVVDGPDDLVMANLAIDLQVWGQFSQDGVVAALPDDPVPEDDEGNDGVEASVAFAGDLRRLRLIEVMLAVRTPREDPEFTVALGAGADEAPMDRNWFDVDPLQVGHARSASLVGSVDVTSLAPEL